MEILSTPLFSGLNQDEMEEILRVGEACEKIYPKNTTILNSGAMINRTGLILSGQVNVVSVDYWGHSSILNHLSEGDIFGEGYALLHEPLLVDVIAVEKTQVLFINFSDVFAPGLKEASWFNTLSQNMIEILVRRNMNLSLRMFCTAEKSIRKRVLTYLSFMEARTGSNHFKIPFNRQQLADYLNVDRSALSTELSKMVKDGKILCKKNEFTLLKKDQEEG